MGRLTVVLAVFAVLVAAAGQGLCASRIEGQTVEYKAGPDQMKGFLAYDASIQGKRPGVLVAPEWWGVTEYTRIRARMLAQLGYTAFVVDMYGQGKQATTPDEAQKLSSEVMKNFNVGKTRFLAAMDVLKKQPTVDPDRIAAIGYCFGGGVVLNMARQGADLKGVVSFHGTLGPVTPAKPGEVRAKILVLHGDADTIVPPKQVQAFKEEMKKAGADYRVVTYPGAKHSFTNPEADDYAKRFNMPVGYNPQADRESWEEMKRFLQEVLGR